jgi:hypothetical protein
MRAILAILAGLGFLVSGCGSDAADKKKPPPPPAQGSEAQPPAKDDKKYSDYGPGDPRGDVKAYKHAKEAGKKMEDSRKDVPVPAEEPE